MSTPVPRIGWWWSEKKSRKFNVEEFADILKACGFELAKIDVDRPLADQGPFVAIVHKLCDIITKAVKGDEPSIAFCHDFENYEKEHPEVLIIDPFANVYSLIDRYKHYKLIEDYELQHEGDLLIPPFVELVENNVKENLAKLQAAGVDFPCVCKPSVAFGSSLAHEMSIIFNEEGLKDIQPPCVLQKFINHNAVLFKLFVIGEKYFVIERPSLKNFIAGSQKTIFFHSHDISKPHSASALTELDESEAQGPIVWPDRDKLDHIVEALSNCLGLSLFGIDVIIDNKSGRYAIVDVNSFPGYDEVDNFFQILCDMLQDRISRRKEGLSEAISKPMLCNSPEVSTVRVHPKCRHFNFESLPLYSNNRDSKAVIPYFPKCFCCPISGLCSNFGAKTHIPQRFPARGERDPALLFHSPEQEDSGIETSDSCDEKKEIRTVRRQHFRNLVI